MNSSPAVPDSLRWVRTLGPGSVLACTRGRRGQRWVLKAIGTGEAPSTLRADFQDLAMLRHPCLAVANRIEGTQAEQLYVSRPWIDGEDIANAITAKKPSTHGSWLLAAAEALAVLHGAGFLHRNLRASNILVPRGSQRRRRVVLCDPAWWPDGSGPDTPHLLAPEQRDEPISTPRAELFALGHIFYVLIAGASPTASLDDLPRPLSEMNSEVPSDLDRVLIKLLHPDPNRRHRNASELVDDLKRIVADGCSTNAALELFVGRTQETDEGIRRLENRSRPAVTAVSGEAGTGKSALLRRLSLEAELLGYRVLRLQCLTGRAMLDDLARSIFPGGAAGRSFRRRLRRLVAAPRNRIEDDHRSRNVLLRGLLDLFYEATGVVPALLVVDDLQHADAFETELISTLVREIAAGGRDGQPTSPPLSLLVSYRSESPFRSALRPLLRALASPLAEHRTIDLGPLPVESVQDWLRRSQAEPASTVDVNELYARTRGNPLALSQAIRGEPESIDDRPGEHGPAGLFERYFTSLPDEERSVLEILAVLGRPATPEWLEKITDTTTTGLRRQVDSLRRAGSLREESGSVFFRHASFQDWLLEYLAPDRARTIHGRIADALQEARTDDVAVIAEHWLLSGSPERGRDLALEAASRCFPLQPGRALELYRRTLELIRPEEVVLRQRVTEDTAHASAAAGDPRAAASLLEELLEENDPGSEASSRWRCHTGVYLHRAGEISSAVAQLEKGLADLGTDATLESLRLRLRMESELAEIASNQGDYPRAERICNQALERLAHRESERGDPGVRRLEMVVLETLAHLCLRRFEYSRARELFERSLALGDGIEAPEVKSLILNNLGSLHVQENRFAQALTCFERAAKFSARLGDEPSLAIAHGNLAVIHARCGRPEKADAALSLSAQHESRADSARARCIRLHSSGLVDLMFGRYRSATEIFRAAIVAGEELEDSFMISFDWVFLGESQLLRGEFRTAKAAFGRARELGARLPGPVSSMLDARESLEAALRGDRRESSAALARFSSGEAESVSFVDAWNRLYVGWANRLLGDAPAAREALRHALSFFRRARVPAGEIHAELELAALDLDGGRSNAARKRLHSLQKRFVLGEGALRSPMLSCRLLLYLTRALVERRRPDHARASSTLIEAESFLIGRGLRDLESLARKLRLELRKAGSFTTPTVTATPAEHRTSHETGAFLDSLRDFLSRVNAELGETNVGLRHELREIEEGLQRARRSAAATEAKKRSVVAADSILGRSPASRRLAEQVRQVARTALPVLIRGETGSGKELVARAIHGESARTDAPFVSVNCGALPEALLEAELFGYLPGAFTGAEREHSGLLQGADGGSFLFDEISELPPTLQTKLLRALDRGSFRPIGAEEELSVNVRFLFATQRRLPELIDEGRFRADLYYRLNSCEIVVPPLRERLEDLPDLVSTFLSDFASENTTAALDQEALAALAAYSWPGNVRELRNVVTRLALTCGERIGADMVRRDLGRTTEDGLFSSALLRSRPLPALLEQLEREYLTLLFRDSGGDMENTARRLGITRRALYVRLQKLGIQPKELKKELP